MHIELIISRRTAIGRRALVYAAAGAVLGTPTLAAQAE
jgi:hypothetical protein